MLCCNDNTLFLPMADQSLGSGSPGPLFEWIREGKLRQEDYISSEFPIEQINDAIAATNAGLAIKTMLRF